MKLESCIIKSFSKEKLEKHYFQCYLNGTFFHKNKSDNINLLRVV